MTHTHIAPVPAAPAVGPLSHAAAVPVLLLGPLVTVLVAGLVAVPGTELLLAAGLLLMWSPLHPIGIGALLTFFSRQEAASGRGRLYRATLLAPSLLVRPGAARQLAWANVAGLVLGAAALLG